MRFRSAKIWFVSVAVMTAATPLALGDDIRDDVKPLRFNLTATHSDVSGAVLGSNDLETQTLTAVAGQIEFHPFGDEFYLAAGALQSLDNQHPDWARLSADTPLTPLTSSDLVPLSDTERLENLVRYFGAGLRVHSIDNWSLTVEGGAYFGDSRQDQLQMFDPETGQTRVLLEDLDTMDRGLVRNSDTRSVKPVGHLVFRRRF